MQHKDKLQKIVHILIKSEFYFTLSLQERHDLIRNMLRKLPLFS
jgi:hypothetical protein